MNSIFISTALLTFIALALFIVKSLNYKANIFLACAYLCLAYVLYYSYVMANNGSMPPLLVHTNLIFFYFTYPLLYMYVTNTTNATTGLQWKHAIHLLAVIPGLVNYIYYQIHGPDKERDVTELLSGTHAARAMHMVGLIILLFYFVQSFRLIVAYNHKIETRPCAKDRQQISWLKTLFPLFMIPCFIQFFSVSGVHLSLNASFYKDMMLFIIIAFLLLTQLHFWNLFIQTEQPAKTIHVAHIKHNNDELIIKYGDSLHTHMVINKAFTAPNLRVNSFAQKMKLTPKEVSHLIRLICKKTFPEYVMECRIKYALTLLDDPVKRKWNSAAIAKACGFSSRERFSRCFKKIVGESFESYVHKLT